VGVLVTTISRGRVRRVNRASQVDSDGIRQPLRQFQSQVCRTCIEISQELLGWCTDVYRRERFVVVETVAVAVWLVALTAMLVSAGQRIWGLNSIFRISPARSLCSVKQDPSRNMFLDDAEVRPEGKGPAQAIGSESKTESHSSIVEHCY
jgi:hypothetical protein